jgi:hypothetical protein
MHYPVELRDFEGQDIQLVTAAFFKQAKIQVNGADAEKGDRRGVYLLRNNAGKLVKLTLSTVAFDIVPQLDVDGKLIQLVEPFKWYHYFVSALPLILVMIGGGLGGVIGTLSFIGNLRIFRLEWPVWVRYLAVIVDSVLAFFVYLFFATVINLLIS